MKTTVVIVTVLTVAALGAMPAVASAAKCSNGEQCRIAVNHNEVLTSTTGGVR